MCLLCIHGVVSCVYVCVSVVCTYVALSCLYSVCNGNVSGVYVVCVLKWCLSDVYCTWRVSVVCTWCVYRRGAVLFVHGMYGVCTYVVCTWYFCTCVHASVCNVYVSTCVYMCTCMCACVCVGQQHTPTLYTDPDLFACSVSVFVFTGVSCTYMVCICCVCLCAYMVCMSVVINLSSV